MDVSRRAFFKTGIAGAVGITVFGFDAQPILAQADSLKISRTTETRSTCPYCAVSCGVIIHTIGDKAKNVTPQVVHVEGDPDHPINRGTLCPKGASLQQDIQNERRLLKPQVRRPGLRSLGRHLLEPGHRRDRAVDQEDARRDLHRDRRQGQHGEPLRDDRLHRRLHRYQRVQLPGRENDAELWGWCAWKTRRVFDTAPRSQVWDQLSDAGR